MTDQVSAASSMGVCGGAGGGRRRKRDEQSENRLRAFGNLVLKYIFSYGNKCLLHLLQRKEERELTRCIS